MAPTPLCGPLSASLVSLLPLGGELDLHASLPGHFIFRSMRLGESRVFDLDAALPVLAPPLLKAGEAIPDGARWITVHPNGDGSKGVPVLVQEEKKGSGIWHVISGAGGSLNYLKIRGVKSEGAYRDDARDRRVARQAEKKARLATDKESGLHEEKQAARLKLQAQVRAAEDDFLHAVATSQGWGPEVMTPETPAHLSAEAAEKTRRDHRRGLLRKAREVVGLQRQALLQDADLRAAAFDTGIPMEGATDEQVSVADLSPSKPMVASGVGPDFKARAEAAGLSQEGLQAEVATIKAGGLDPDAPAAAAAGFGKATRDEKAAAIRAELKGLSSPVPELKPAIARAKEAVALLAAQKRLALVTAKARAARAEVDASLVEPKAYVLAVSPAEESKAMEDEARTLGVRSFLAAAQMADAGAIEPHVAAGAFAAINAAGLNLAGVGAIDRSAVDVLGAAGAAQVLARRLRLELSPEEFREATAVLEAFHRSHSESKARDVLEQVAELHAVAAEPLPEVVGVDQVLTAAEAHQRRAQALADANKALGQALGEFEAGAALVASMQAPLRSTVQVSLGSADLAMAVKQVRALGLVPGDYNLAREGGNVFLTVKPSGMDRLAQSVDRDALRIVSRNVAIARGDHDEGDWMPKGFARRADLAVADLKPGVAESFAQPFEPGKDLQADLRTYIGARAADGHLPAEILSDVQSQAFFEKVGPGRAAEYRAALDAVAPNKIGGKGLQRAEQLAPMFDGYADDHVAALGGKRLPLHAQRLTVDEVSQEAAHRALSAHPEGVAAFKPVGELSVQDQRALREWFATNVAKESPEAAGLRQAHEALLGQEPTKHAEDMFGETSVNPDWHAWDASRQTSAAKVAAAGFGWSQYVKAMGSPQRALASVQDQVRSRVSEAFAAAHNRLRPGAPLALGRTVIRDNLRHLSAVDPEARAAAEARHAALIDSLRERSAGKYSAGSVSDKIDAAAEQQDAFEQSQMGFFSTEEAPAKDRPLGADERHTLGHAAEHRLAAMVQAGGAMFKPGQPVKLFHASMSGKDGAVRQRAIKHVQANKRSVLGLGVGTGKTAIGLGAFAHLHAEGKVKKGVFIVPSIVQGQFGAEALRFLQPGAHKWHCEPGASHAERVAAYRDAGTHFHVVTHQSFRDDVLKLAAGQEGTTPEAVAAKLSQLSPSARQIYVRGVMDKEGIAFDFAMADEGHGLLDREGKENSRLSTVAQAVTDGTEYYVHASGDPVKNDVSEAHSLLSKMDPVRYADRGAFMRKYGGDTSVARDGLRRELARHVYAASLSPDVKVNREVRSVPLSEPQKVALEEFERNATRVRLARMQGKTDAAAAKAVAPHLFDGAPEGMHAELVRQVHDSLPLIRQTAVRHILDNHPEGGKLDAALAEAKARRGKPGVVFARSLRAVAALKARLEAAGHRVSTITGADSSEQKAAKIRSFNPDKGERTSDIVLCSDAGAVGANLQSGSWLMQFDTPDTAMTHAQRQGRVNRTGQRNDVDLIDLVHDHASEHRARDRLKTKYGLRELVTSPLETLDDSGLAHFLVSARAEKAAAHQ